MSDEDYAGDIMPAEAWKILADDPKAVLVDVRTTAEWAYVGQADISTVVAYSFTKKVRPHLDLAGECPALTAFVERCEALDAFSSAPVPG